MNDGRIDADLIQMRKDAWVEQLECANSTTLAFLDMISEDAVVILTSDHGPDTALPEPGAATGPWNLEERLPTYTATRVPRCDAGIPADVALVNLFRYVLSCLADETPDPLPDVSYVASFGGYIHPVKESDPSAD